MLVSGLICTFIGFITVIVGMLLPYPLWSLRHVEQNQLLMNRNVTNVLKMMVNYYCEALLAWNRLDFRLF